MASWRDEIPKAGTSASWRDEIPTTPVEAPKVPVAPTPEQQVPKGDWLSMLSGFQSGVTAGTGKYLQAGMGYLGDAVRGRGRSWDQALEDVQIQQDWLQHHYPTERLAGQVGGGVVLAGATGGTSILGNIGVDTGIGAVSGFTANPYTDATTALKDTGIGAGVGAVVGTVGAGLSKVTDAVAKRVTIKALGGSIQATEDALKAAKGDAVKAAEYAKALPKTSAATNFEQATFGLPPAMKEQAFAQLTATEKAAILAAREAEAAAATTAAKIAEHAGDLKYLNERLVYAKKAKLSEFRDPNNFSLRGDPRGGVPMANAPWVGYRAGKDLGNQWNALKGAAPGMGAGALGGAGYSVASGGDPWKGALVGAGMGGGAGAAIASPFMRAAGTRAATGPLNGSLGMLGRTSTDVAVPWITELNQ